MAFFFLRKIITAYYKPWAVDFVLSILSYQRRTLRLLWRADRKYFNPRYAPMVENKRLCHHFLSSLVLSVSSKDHSGSQIVFMNRFCVRAKAQIKFLFHFHIFHFVEARD